MNEQLLREKLTGLAEASGEPDELRAWEHITAGIERDERRTTVRRTVWGVGAATLVAAAIVALFAVTDDGDRQTVITPPATDQTTRTTTVLQHTALPAHPVLVSVVSDVGDTRLDVYDGETGELWTKGVATTIFSFDHATVGPDHRIYYKEETGDTSAIKSVDPYSGEPARVAFGLESEVHSPAFDPDGTTMAYGIAGVGTEGTRIGLVDLATGAKRVLDFSDGGSQFKADDGSIYYVEFSGDGRQLYFSGNKPGGSIWAVDVDAASLDEAAPLIGPSSEGAPEQFRVARTTLVTATADHAQGESGFVDHGDQLIVLRMSGPHSRLEWSFTQQPSETHAMLDADDVLSFDADADGDLILGLASGKVEKRTVTAAHTVLWSITVDGTPTMVFI